MSTATPVGISVKDIVVATDFSVTSSCALRDALGIARRYGATVYLLHVLDPVLYATKPFDGLSDAMDSAFRKGERIKADIRRGGEFGDNEIKVLVYVGGVWQTILDVAQEKHGDLIVLGTTGRTGFRKLILGSVAEKIFRESTYPVLTVGPNRIESKCHGTEPRRLLVPTDLSEYSIDALLYAVSLASRSGARIALVHVIEPGSEGPDSEEQKLRSAESRLRELARSHQGICAPPDIAVKVGQPPENIVEFAEQTEADLILMGLRSAPHVKAAWQTAYDVVCRAACPVLTVRNQFSLPAKTITEQTN